jgi:hypothetical protein
MDWASQVVGQQDLAGCCRAKTSGANVGLVFHHFDFCADA